MLWVRADSLRGRGVQVFSYAVDLAHSQYRVSHIVQGRPKAVLSAFHGLVYVDRETGVVSRITQETDSLPEDFPLRRMSLSLEYGDVSVGGQVTLCRSRSPSTCAPETVRWCGTRSASAPASASQPTHACSPRGSKMRPVPVFPG